MPLSKADRWSEVHRPFLTEDYRFFLEAWGPHCGAPLEVFEGQLQVTILAELQAAGRDVYALLQKSLLVQEPKWKALDRLLRDLDAYCEEFQHYNARGDELRERISRARHVLGLTELVKDHA